MSKFMWILGATCLGVAGYVFFTDSFDSQDQSADALDEFGQSVSNWGTKNRVTGTGGQLGGKLKQGLGKLTGDDELQSEGVLDEGIGTVKDVAGKAAHAVSNALYYIASRGGIRLPRYLFELFRCSSWIESTKWQPRTLNRSKASTHF